MSPRIVVAERAGAVSGRAVEMACHQFIARRCFAAKSIDDVTRSICRAYRCRVDIGEPQKSLSLAHAQDEKPTGISWFINRDWKYTSYIRSHSCQCKHKNAIFYTQNAYIKSIIYDCSITPNYMYTIEISKQRATTSHF